MTFKSNISFFEKATSAGTSEVYQNRKSDSITLQVHGTFTSASATVEARTDINAPFTEIALIDLSNYGVISDGAITKAGRYAIGADGIRELRVVLNSVSGGDISVSGLATSTSEN